MKKHITAVLLFISLAISAFSADLQEAEDLYRQGRFAAALAMYEELLQTYPKDPHLYYNIGNCYFKMGTTGLAAANYYRAFQLAPRDKDIRHNLALTLNNSGEKLVPAGMPEVLHKAFFGVTLTELKGIVFIVLWLFCITGSIWLVKRRLGWITVCLLLMLLLSGGWYGWRAHLATEPLAIVAAPVAELRSGPGTNFPASANVAQGHLLLLQDSRDQWEEVIVKSQGIKGWIEKSAIEKI